MIDDLPPLIPGDDFWSRQANAQTQAFECAPYGIPAHITANDADVLRAASLSARRYSRATEATGRPIRIRIVVRQDVGDLVPADLSERLRYSGVGDWITVSAGAWGHGFANLDARAACIFLSRALAADARLVSRYFIDHYVLNLALTEWAMLHASCVLDVSRQRLVVMIAAHNVGKSTTALHLTRAGCAFLADGMALLRRRGEHFVVGGYPIGEVKLRDDVLSGFPEYVHVREHQKTIIDLRAAHPERIVESLIEPKSIQLCFIERGMGARTHLAPISIAEAARRLAANTVYWNDAAKLEHNTATLQHLLHVAGLHRLQLGSDPGNLVAATSELLADAPPTQSR
jgi:hypothetical protein